MTPGEITALFISEIFKKDFSKRSGIDRRNVYKYRNSTTITIGTMLQVLYQLNAIEITKK